ncbi:NUDIX hydrolase [Nocardioides bizhenqiangii]|uniref:NUDIX domain-containing protein n=1 Tax=Nocardioides bizhenqiangii TaxID=3095076 RepID=A0ABZ0ZRB5_9ACTN|nr:MULTISPECIES: NUDIX domain-containing protein [unclassified Nocardioides]MDZ5619979.1 NUDIX domain-containing protein [Nocardioides sp. HM23]WQQ26018.1 NUDIX domain-containing protein [Nocardioides sp. HM61]
MTTSKLASPPDVRAAGVVTFRPGREVLLVHRPKYDDWSFPKGKLERWEHPTSAAVREVAEETGVHVRLGPPLSSQRYPTTGRRMKTVDYWTGRAVGDDDVSLYRPNQEIDQVAWVRIDKAEAMLTYRYDRETLDEAVKVRRRTHAIVVLRHARARSRNAWKTDDQLRPLLKAGAHESERVVPLLAAYDVTRVVSSPAIRCLQTVVPYAETTGWEIETRRRLAEEHATTKGIEKVVAELLEDDQGAVLCSHRPVLPKIYGALGLRARQVGDELDPAEMLVVHVRKSKIVAVERHRIG